MAVQSSCSPYLSSLLLGNLEANLFHGVSVESLVHMLDIYLSLSFLY